MMGSMVLTGKSQWVITASIGPSKDFRVCRASSM